MIEIHIEGENNLQRALINLETNIDKPIAALEEIGDYMLGSINKNFEAEGRPERWAPLSPSTIAGRRNKKKSTIKILQDTGMLRKSINYLATDDQVAIGTNLKYAAIHQFGGDIQIPPHQRVINFRKFKSGKRKGKVRFAKSRVATFSQKVNVKQRFIHIPARPFLLFQDEDKQAMNQVLVKHLKSS